MGASSISGALANGSSAFIPATTNAGYDKARLG
jgi:hypothetical protein